MNSSFDIVACLSFSFSVACVNLIILLSSSSSSRSRADRSADDVVAVSNGSASAIIKSHVFSATRLDAEPPRDSEGETTGIWRDELPPGLTAGLDGEAEDEAVSAVAAAAAAAFDRRYSSAAVIDGCMIKL